MPRLSSLSSRSLSGIGLGTAPVIPGIISYYGASGQYIEVRDVDVSAVTSATAKFGTKSLKGTALTGFLGTFNSITVPLSQTLTAPFTLEGWVNHGAAYAAPNYFNATLGILTNSAGTSISNLTSYAGNNTTVSTGWTDGITSYSSNDQSGPASSTGIWVHVAVAWHTSTTFSAWVNGTRRITNSAPNPISGGIVNLLLNKSPAGAGVSTYFDDIRVSNIDRYGTVSTITVPTTAFTSDANTLALVNFETIL
jgi:hypothetical protein